MVININFKKWLFLKRKGRGESLGGEIQSVLIGYVNIFFKKFGVEMF